MAVDPQIVDRWRRLRLAALQTALDEAAADIAVRQDEADVSRKKLIEQSKLFKQTAAEDVRKIVSPLMKGFQAEIDGLTKRSLQAETVFLDVYKKIAEMPDPTPMLDMAAQWQTKAQKLHDMEMEVSSLRETIASYNQEFAEIKNQGSFVFAFITCSCRGDRSSAARKDQIL
jgi:homeobox protein cut-like